MLSFLRPTLSRITTPIATVLLRTGLTPDAVTVIGTVISCSAAIWLFPTGHLFVGTLVIWAFVMFDMLDGAMARTRGGGRRFGAVLDASCDRITDGVIFSSIAWWVISVREDQLLFGATLVCLVASQVISYIKARAEASGLSAEGGLIERTERLIIVLVGTGLTGLGLSWAIVVAIWLLVVGSAVTVLQRFWEVAHAPGAQEIIPCGMTGENSEITGEKTP